MAPFSVQLSVSIGGHKVGSMFADHHRGGVRVGVDDFRHNRRIDYTQISYTTNSQMAVDHRRSVGTVAHLAGAHWMVAGCCDGLQV